MYIIDNLKIAYGSRKEDAGEDQRSYDSFSNSNWADRRSEVAFTRNEPWRSDSKRWRMAVARAGSVAQAMTLASNVAATSGTILPGDLEAAVKTRKKRRN